jgi:hypothetical protein
VALASRVTLRESRDRNKGTNDAATLRVCCVDTRDLITELFRKLRPEWSVNRQFPLCDPRRERSDPIGR